ncbi:DUF3048 domain-containing protein [Candidatus Uhrbacteria bacterium]|nr:DUF3048 domain-containing protein [Candidatus Uhrbacteria bacterium]
MKLNPEQVLGYAKRFRWQIAIGTVFVVLLCTIVLWLVLSGATRSHNDKNNTGQVFQIPTSTEALTERRLDGVLVSPSIATLAPRAVMIENHPDARPVSGLSKASIVIEAPVEGGITRYMALFAASTTLPQVGPVRSARPYYVDWADAWNAPYFHVGGSPEALTKISSMAGFTDVNEFAQGNSFWRDTTRYAPHNVYTKDELMDAVVAKKGAASSTAPLAWHFQDAASSTDRGELDGPRVPYGGSFNVRWAFEKERGVYVRSLSGVEQKDRDGSSIESENVIVIKTEQTILDSYGRLQVRTTGSGQAMAYRDGKKFNLRWRRSAGEPIRFESTDGTEFLFTRGRTWIEVTTSDVIFGGVGG